MFKKNMKELQKGELAPPADSNGEKDAVASEPVKEAEIIYPSGLKLALLMTSMFVGMFLVALVRSKKETHRELLSAHVG